jgi:hypothetical protein
MTRTEAQTCSELIDSQLAQSGWNVKDPTQVPVIRDRQEDYYRVLAVADSQADARSFTTNSNSSTPSPTATAAWGGCGRA